MALSLGTRGSNSIAPNRRGQWVALPLGRKPWRPAREEAWACTQGCGLAQPKQKRGPRGLLGGGALDGECDLLGKAAPATCCLTGLLASLEPTQCLPPSLTCLNFPASGLELQGLCLGSLTLASSHPDLGCSCCCFCFGFFCFSSCCLPEKDLLGLGYGLPGLADFLTSAFYLDPLEGCCFAG